MAISTIGPTGLSSAVGQIGKNMVTNGNFSVAQRGTLTGLGAATAAISADQWKFFVETTAARFTTSVVAATTAMIADGVANRLKVDVTTVDSSMAGSDFIGVEQRFEGQHLQHLLYGTAGAKELTVTFWFQSPKSGTHHVYLVQNDGNSGCPMTFTVASADTAEKFSVTFPALTTSGQDFDNDTAWSMSLGFPILSHGYESTANQWNAGGTWRSSSAQQNLADNTANNIFIGGVQLEVGGVATDFEHEPFSVTLAKCHRYLYILGGDTLTQNDSTVTGGMALDADTARFILHYPTRMRTTPTFSMNDDAEFYIAGPNGAGKVSDAGPANVALNAYSLRFECDRTDGEMTAGFATQMYHVNQTGIITVTAEV